MDAAGFEFGSEGPTGVGLTEVAGNDGHRDAVIAGEFVGQALEPVRSASDEHEVGPTSGELACELGAETGACSGDDGGLFAVVNLGHGIHSRHDNALSAS